tara:strand:+ start:173 stop:397 length:225 start_codon:yes stop_codon:yes gene_type:complete
MRQTLTKPKEEYDQKYMNYFVSEVEQRDGLSFKKGERIEANGGDQTEIVLVSANGTKYKLQVSDAGALSTTTTV